MEDIALNATHRFVASQDVELYVKEAGDPAKPGILFLHGFPDDHQVWASQFNSLSKDYHVICFDTRGVGKSSPSKQKKAYRINKILKDIDTVISATRGSEGKVHLVGHDWGSVLGWSYVFDPIYQQRVLTWTSISGPPLGIVWQKARDDFMSLSPRRVTDALSQLMHSWYIYSMFIPGFWEKLMMPTSSLWLRPVVYELDMQLGDFFDSESRATYTGRMKKALGLYRENVFNPPKMPEPNSCRVPTQLIVAKHDKFIRPAIFDSLDNFVVDITKKQVNAGHWVQLSNAEKVSKEIREFIGIKG
ncbi:MAG: alpha/beta fold hydrolase [Pseudomonadales bacterium]|nr:alpha/beta fold hydrolase [Pseudomonadales bacterium]